MVKFSTMRAVRRAGFALCLAALGLAGLTPTRSMAQGLFSPAYTVDGQAVTNYELEQRTLFLEVLRLPGDPAEVAATELVNDRLKQKVLREVGIEISTEALDEAMEGFAQRANLSRADFVKALAQEGVDEETFRDFVRINLEWRDFISGQFLGQARPTQDEIDRALGQDGNGGLRVLLSEIVIPVNEQNFEAAEAEAKRISELTSFDDFSEAAREFSATESRTNGGRMDWMPINNLPPALRPVILALAPGEITAPLNIPNAIALFQLRDIQEGATPTPRYSEIEYAVYYLAGGRSPETLAHAAMLRETNDTCNDLYGAALGLPREVLFRDSLPPSKIPRNIALELAKLDPGEVSTSLTTQDGRLMFIMLCGRSPAQTDEEARDQVAAGLTQQRLNAMSESLIAQLRANAVIVQK